MDTMHAARLHHYGQPLVLEEIPTPRPGPGEVLVRVGGARRPSGRGCRCTTAGMRKRRLPGSIRTGVDNDDERCGSGFMVPFYGRYCANRNEITTVRMNFSGRPLSMTGK